MYIYYEELDIESSWDISDTIGPYPISKGTGKMANQTDKQTDSRIEADTQKQTMDPAFINLVSRI